MILLEAFFLSGVGHKVCHVTTVCFSVECVKEKKTSGKYVQYARNVDIKANSSVIF